MDRLSPFSAMLVRRAGSLLSSGGRRGRLLILLYHRVLPEHDSLLNDEPDAATFAAHMDLVKQSFNALPLLEASQRLRDGSLPARAVSITFDDGYANNLHVAAPILAARGIPATVFVAAGFIGGGRMFNDTAIEAIRRAHEVLDLTDLGLGRFTLCDVAARRSAISQLLGVLKYMDPAERLRTANQIAERVGCELPDELMMTEEQVRSILRYGVEVGAHTMNHPILTRVDAETARREISDSKHRLTEITGRRVESFAFPNGRPHCDYARCHVEMARKTGFQVAVSTAWGAATAESDLLQLPRIAPWGATVLRVAIRIVQSYSHTRAELVR
jgi:peptidoglycan/xylan/chitin deacetylase (PgdA/CDA1 family)